MSGNLMFRCNTFLKKLLALFDDYIKRFFLIMNAVSYNLLAIMDVIFPRGMNLEEERQLVMQAKSDSQSFARLYDIYFHKVYAFVASKISNRSDAEDLTADIFMKVLENLENYEWKGFPFGAWVFKIARNTVIDYYATNSGNYRKPLEEAYSVSEDEEKSSPFKKAEREELAEKVKKVFRNLPEREVTVMELKFFSQLNNREIAEVMELSESNVAVILFRALRKIKPDLKFFV